MPRKITLEAKKGSSVTVDCTNEHSTTSGTPFSPLRQASANMAPAYLRKEKGQLRQAKMKQTKIICFHFMTILIIARKSKPASEEVIANTYAIDNVAEPFPAFASTTSVPPSCVRFVRALISSSAKFAFGVA